MSRHKSKRRGASGPPFVQLHHYLLDSKAWHELSFVARAAYVELCRLYTGTNNGSIALSVRLLAERLPCNKETASRALNELETTGFIAVNKVGRFKGDGSHLSSEYRLTAYRDDTTGELPTKAFDPSKKWTSAPVRKNRTRSPEFPDTKPQNAPSSTEFPDCKADLAANLGTEKPYTYRISTIGLCAHGSSERPSTYPEQALAKRALKERDEPVREDSYQSSSLTRDAGEPSQFDASNIVALFQQRRASAGGVV